MFGAEVDSRPGDLRLPGRRDRRSARPARPSCSRPASPTRGSRRPCRTWARPARRASSRSPPRASRAGQVEPDRRELQTELGFTLDDLGGSATSAVFAAGTSVVDLQVGGLRRDPRTPAARASCSTAISRAAAGAPARARSTPLTVEGADDGFSIQVPELAQCRSTSPRPATGSRRRSVPSRREAARAGDGGLTDDRASRPRSEALGDGSSLAFLSRWSRSSTWSSRPGRTTPTTRRPSPTWRPSTSSPAARAERRAHHAALRRPPLGPSRA